MTTKSIAVVTGASQGIGRATALRLARDFSGVVLVARNKESLEETAIEVRSLGAEAMIYAVDLREPQSAKTVIGEALKRFGRIDALLNIAGAVLTARSPMLGPGTPPLITCTLTRWPTALAISYGAIALICVADT